MEEKLTKTETVLIENRIFTIRGKQVMLDSHLAEIYGIETKILNRAVKRNSDRFPESFRFQLNEKEYENLRFQIGTSSEEHGGRRYLPYVFTEQGVAMLSAVLRSETAINVSSRIMEVFVEMRKLISTNFLVDSRLDKLEKSQLQNEQKFEEIFKALEAGNITIEKGIFFEGQIFDAYHFVAGLIKKAQFSIILIDNYIDDSVLTLFSKRNDNVSLKIYTKQINKQLKLDIEKFSLQYGQIEINEFSLSHDRFLIIDENELYHIGASLKDLGKKWFAFSKMDAEVFSLLTKLKLSN